ncbi:hypothetical protein LTR17_017237 [Elasticomyces elasticus]|nr:hypothetical protein LTR17_017237 [Elasticomyces elasticus]
MRAALILAAATSAYAQFHGRGHGYGGHHGWNNMPGRDWQDVPSSGNTTFTQLTDHNDPSVGTFAQFYFYDTTHWKGPGSPVILFTPGEIAAAGYASYLTINRTTGVLAAEIGAAVIVLEHRYWGTSSPYTELTTANMTYLTLDNSIKDLTYFANTAKLPFAHHGSNAADVPWILMGGSYSGALTAWTESVAPGTFWAYWASSAVVEAISDFWSYFLPVELGMPKNCSSDVHLVIDYMDGVLNSGNESEIYELKDMFGLTNVTHNDDFMGVLENGPWQWQSNQFSSGKKCNDIISHLALISFPDPNGPFYEWCDAVEGVTNATNSTVRPGPEGVGLEKALAGYATWIKNFIPGTCEASGYAEFNGTNNTYCFNTYDATSPQFTDLALDNVYNRQWNWMLCNEPFGYWQDGAPDGTPSLVSRLIDADYWVRQCDLWFPTGPNGETYGIAKGKTEADTNAYTGGWDDRNSTRLLYVNGGYDPWRDATVSADIRPGGPLESTEEVPVLIVPGGFHTSDLQTANGAANASVKAVIDQGLAQMVEWVGEFPKRRHWSA